MQPKMNFNKIWGVYYVFYGFLAHFLLMNIIVAILVEKYINEKDKLGYLYIYYLINIIIL